MRITHIVGARPNFMKAAPVMAALEKRGGVSQSLVHTGQHYDANMSGVFFRQLGLPEPDVNLEVGSGSHAVQTAEIMVRIEKLLEVQRPDWLIVYGDVNSTLASALVCAKMSIPVAHVEAGLRSFDRTMPEEINRLLTDQVSDLLFTPSEDGNENLLREGVSPEKIFLVGNVMIDTLVRLLPEAQTSWRTLRESLSLVGREEYGRGYTLVTLHRPSNVDDPDELRRIMGALVDISENLSVLFPVHPRTRKRLQSLGLELILEQKIKLLEPVSYTDFLALQSHAVVVITDSGGVQEESTFLGVPCLTLRENTERPVTVSLGTNLLLGHNMDRLRAEVLQITNGHGKLGSAPPGWDGKAGERIAAVIRERC